MSVAELAGKIGRDRRVISGAEDGRDVPSELVIHLLEGVLQSEGLIASRYEAFLAEKRQHRLQKAMPSPISAPDCSPDDASVFVSETVADGTLMEPGQRFTKSWTIRNGGAVTWRDRRLTRIGIPSGPGLITTPVQTLIPETAPGQEVTIAMPCIASFVEGSSIASFRMTDSLSRLYFLQRYSIGLQLQVTVVRNPPL